jgi:hypothetical protein
MGVPVSGPFAVGGGLLGSEQLLFFGKLLGAVFLLVRDEVGFRLLGGELGRSRSLGIPINQKEDQLASVKPCSASRFDTRHAHTT